MDNLYHIDDDQNKFLLGGCVMAFRNIFRKHPILALMAAGMLAQSTVAPSLAKEVAVQLVANTNSTSEIESPYKNGQRVEQSEVKKALQYYDAVIYYGDEIYPSSAISNATLLTEDWGIKTLALSGWSASKCALVLTANTSPGVKSTFTQDDMDRGWLREYAERAVTKGDDAFSLGACLNVHPPTSD